MATEQTTDYMRITGRWWQLDTIAEIAQAVGMITDQLGCPPRDAATVLRGHAAAHTQDAAEVAVAVVNRTLSFAP